MKDMKYITLNIIFKLTKGNTSHFLSADDIYSSRADLDETFLTYLEFSKYLNYKRIEKKDCYSLTHLALNYIRQFRQARANKIWTIIGAISSVGALIFSALSFWQ